MQSTKRMLGVLAVVVAALLTLPAIGSAATTTANDDNGGVVYTGAWTDASCTGYYSSDCHYSNDVGATASFVFTGTFVRLIGSRNTDHGKADVQICASDGTGCGAATVIDGKSKIWQKQQVLYANYGLSAGAHMIKVTIRNDTNGSDKYLDVDAFAYGTPLTGTRYVSSTGCNNANAGTSSGAPWCDFANLNGETFAPGAQILLARGSTWNQQLGKLYGEGTSGSRIVVDAYGAGAKPKIDRNRASTDRGIWLDNPSWWTLRNLEVMDTGAGIVAYFTTNGHAGLRFENVYTHHNNVIFNGSPGAWTPQADLPGMYHGAAILISGYVPQTASEYALLDVTIDNHESSTDSDPVDIAGFNPGGGGLDGFLSTDMGSHTVGDITIKNSYWHDNQGSPNFDNLHNLTIRDNLIETQASGPQTIGTTSMFFYSVDDVTVVNNIVRNVLDSGSPDQTGTDLEAFTNDVKFRGNFYGYTWGPAIEWLSFRGSDFSTNHEVSNNAFWANSLGETHQGGALFLLNTVGATQSATVRDNVYYEQSGLVDVEAGSPSFTYANNAKASAAGVFHGADDFSSTQGASNWSYQSHNGAVWSNFGSYDSTNAWWGTSASYVSRFLALPAASSTTTVARAWTAPYAGTVAIRGRALKAVSGGDGVLTKITKDGTKIWPTSGATQAIGASDLSGVDSIVDNVSVSAGNVIRFEVHAGAAGSNTSDALSWAPSVGYTSIANHAATVVEDTTTGTGDGQLNYASGTWSTAGSVHYNTGTTTTARYEVKFTGTQIVVHGGKNTDRGIGAYSICDAAGANCGTETLVDGYAASLQSDQVLWTSPILPPGQHTLKVRTTNTKHASSSGRIVDVDRVVVSANAFVVNDDEIGSGDGQIAYTSGTWSTSGEVHYNAGTTTTAYALVKFTGTQVVVQGGRGPDRGITAYSVCDASGASCGAETLVDHYAASLVGRQVQWTSPILSSGQHTVKIRATNSKNASSSARIVDVDRVVVN